MVLKKYYQKLNDYSNYSNYIRYSNFSRHYPVSTQSIKFRLNFKSTPKIIDREDRYKSKPVNHTYISNIILKINILR